MLLFLAVNTVTVQSLKILASKHLNINKSLVINLIERSEIFSSQNNRSIRKSLVENICNFPSVIMLL
jgi:hypothetical protein